MTFQPQPVFFLSPFTNASSKLMNLRRIAALSLFITLALVPTPAQLKVIGYYPAWSTSALPAANIRFNYLTHINHAFAFPDSSGNLRTRATWRIPDPDLISAAHAAGRKVSISLGGGADSYDFPKMVASQIKRAKFISDLVAFMRSNGYDGADLDWEGPRNNVEKANLTSLVQEMRQAFTAANPSWILTMAIGATNWSGQWHDYQTLKQHVDWFNIMTYDIHGSWSHAGHNSPLYSPTSGCNDGSIDFSVNYHFVGRGIPKSQLVVGVPFYGWRFECLEGYYGLYMPITRAEQLTYATIKERLDRGLGTRVWDDVCKVPYLTYAAIVLLSYDDSLSLSLKCKYVKENNLAGVMIWALGQDAVTPSSQPMMEAVGRAMQATTNVIADLRPPRSLALHDAYPNPFNPSTTISYELPHSGYVSLKVVDVFGREVARLIDESREAGRGAVRFEASEFRLSSGTYFCVLTQGGIRAVKRLVFLK